MASTIQILQDLEKELESHIIEFEKELINRIQSLDHPGSLQNAPAASWQGRFGKGGLERGPGLDAYTGSTSKPKWGGVKGLWNWIVNGGKNQNPTKSKFTDFPWNKKEHALSDYQKFQEEIEAEIEIIVEYRFL